MSPRQPAVAGRFYPAEQDACRASIGDLEHRAAEWISASRGACFGGVVPHAGWMFSGAVAAAVIRSLATSARPRTFVVLGAMHRFVGRAPCLYAAGEWQTPLGPMGVDAELADELARGCPEIVDDARAHFGEHSIEVELPLIQALVPDARFVPIVVPPTEEAADFGGAMGRVLRGRSDVVCLASSDLTHYGPGYGFTPYGIGEDALRRVRKENDRRLIELLVELRAEEIVGQAARDQSACGAGALAATVAACREMGAVRGRELVHRTSADVIRERTGRVDDDAVGYVGIVFEGGAVAVGEGT